MKECPICGATCFDDMKTCFGCMHRFEDEEAHVLASGLPCPELPSAIPEALHFSVPVIERDEESLLQLEEPPLQIEKSSLQVEEPLCLSRQASRHAPRRLSGREVLHRRGSAVPPREHVRKEVHTSYIALPEQQATYELVVSLSPKTS